MLDIHSIFQIFVLYFKCLFHILNIYSIFQIFIPNLKYLFYIPKICVILYFKYLFCVIKMALFSSLLVLCFSFYSVLNIRSAFQMYVLTGKYSS